MVLHFELFVFSVCIGSFKDQQKNVLKDKEDSGETPLSHVMSLDVT